MMCGNSIYNFDVTSMAYGNFQGDINEMNMKDMNIKQHVVIN